MAARQAVETDEMRRQLGTVAELLDEALADPTEAAEALGNGSTAPKSVPLAVYAACRTDGFRAAVTFAVRCGGDTDRSGAIAGARHGRKAIPSSWVDVLEDGTYARSHVERLAASLAAQAMSD
jgi:ADP-ribosylglycohydrolase